MSPLQRAYSVGRLPELPLGGLECLAYVEFHGARLDVAVLQDAVRTVHRHAALRSVFDLDGSVLRDSEVPAPVLALHDVRADPAGERERIRRDLMRTGVDTSCGRNWAVALSTGEPSDQVLHLAFSLAAVDVAGVGVILHDLAAVCRGQEGGVERIERIAGVQEQLVEQGRRRSSRRLKGSAPLLSGPDLLGLREDVVDDPAVTTLRRVIPQEQWEGLVRRARAYSVSTAALVLAIYERALRRWSTRQDFSVTVAALDLRGTEALVADRTVAYAHRARDAASFPDEVAAAATDLRHRLVEHRDVMTEMREAQAAGEPVTASRVVFTYAAEMTIFTPLVLEVLGAPRSWGQTPQSAFDLRLVRLNDRQVEITADVRTAALPLRTAQAIFELVLEHVEDVVATGAPGADLPRAQAAVRAQANASAPLPPALLHQGVREQRRLHPGAVAVQEAATGRALTYAELDARALAVAGRIAAVATPGQLVAVQMPRGIEQVATILGVLYAGCAYLPISNEAPPARVERIRERAQWAALVTPGGIEPPPEGTVEPLAEPVPAAPGDLAYVIFTSGSTGEPKGVAITHAAARNTIDDLRARHGLGPADTVLGVSSIDFDLSVYDIFGSFAAGARLITVDEAETRDPFRWAETIRTEGVTVWNSVPMLLEMLIAAGQQLPSLRTFLVSGDRIPLDLPERSRTLAPGSTFVAMGGATEGSIWSNEHVITGAADLPAHWPSVPYGLPLSGQKYRVVDEQGRDRPDGCLGEFLIGGAGVAEGYYRDPERTAASFFTGPDGERWYRTGDLGVWEEGRMFIVGRRDTQVKIRGHRVECGEAESRMDEHPGVAQTAIVPIRERSALGAAFVPAAGQATPDAKELADYLAAQLPWYMVPAVLLSVVALPVTANGKVDRKRVAQMLEQSSRNQQTPEAAQDDDVVLAEVLDVWSELLLRSAGADSNFFALGGDSLTATRMCALLRERGVAAELPDLFRTPVAGAFAAACALNAHEQDQAPGEGTTQIAPVRMTWRGRAAAEGVSREELGLVEWCRWMWRHSLLGPGQETGKIADDADFFALGGDSLAAARLCADLRDSGVEATVADVFRHPRFADFQHRCTVLEPGESHVGHGPRRSGTDDDPQDRFPLTGLQLAYALGSDGIPGVVRASPCVAVVVRSDDPDVTARWEEALAAVVRHHEVLRLVRSGDFSQRVVTQASPEIVQIPLPLTDEQFRDLLRRAETDASAAPAVRAFVRSGRREELGLVFSYLALDSTSVAVVLRDLAAIAAGDDGIADAASVVGISAFRRYAEESTQESLRGRVFQGAEGGDRADRVLPPAPRIPVLHLPEIPVDFISTGQVLDRLAMRSLRQLARTRGITVNSVLLHAFASALAAAAGQRRVTVNIPAATRPAGAQDALGQFSELALCEVGEDMSLREVHEALGLALAEAGSVPLGSTTERQRYPVVFTSLLGSPLSEDLAGGAVRTVWTHTRTPAVLIDCQITPMPGEEVEVRWDMPRGVVDSAFVEEAFTDFAHRLQVMAARNEAARV